MSYQRVLPRDLFNKAKLLKCLGQISLHIVNEQGGLLEEHFNTNYDKHFNILQHGLDDGSIYCENVYYYVGKEGRSLDLRSPLNSREPYPLLCRLDDDTEIQVFNDDGSFSDEFKTLIGVPHGHRGGRRL